MSTPKVKYTEEDFQMVGGSYKQPNHPKLPKLNKKGPEYAGWWALASREPWCDNKKVPDCYDGGTPKKQMKDALYDFYPDLPWDDTSVKALEFMLSDPECLRICKRFKEVFDFDFEAELRRGLKVHQYERDNKD